MFAGLDLAIKLHGSPFFLIYPLLKTLKKTKMRRKTSSHTKLNIYKQINKQ